MKYKKKTCFQKCVILHCFRENGLRIRNQRKKLHMVAPGENNFRRTFEILQRNCWMLKVISSKTRRNEAFQALGVLKNDFSWPKAAWSIFQSLF